MLSLMFWIALFVALGLALRSYKLWEGYNRGAVQRVPLVNTLVATGLAGASAVGLFFLRLVGF